VIIVGKEALPFRDSSRTVGYPGKKSDLLGCTDSTSSTRFASQVVRPKGAQGGEFVRRLAFQPFQKSKCALECQST
jgi:hypothetical protein